MREAVLAPSGLYIIVRENIGKPGWVVRVLNFATWRHRQIELPDESAARTEFLKWTL